MLALLLIPPVELRVSRKPLSPPKLAESPIIQLANQAASLGKKLASRSTYSDSMSSEFALENLCLAITIMTAINATAEMIPSVPSALAVVSKR